MKHKSRKAHQVRKMEVESMEFWKSHRDEPGFGCGHRKGRKTIKMMTFFIVKQLWRLYFKVFRRYRRLELKYVSYEEGDCLIRQSAGQPESEQWTLAIPEEDTNHAYGMVYLERRVRITE